MPIGRLRSQHNRGHFALMSDGRKRGYRQIVHGSRRVVAYWSRCIKGLASALCRHFSRWLVALAVCLSRYCVERVTVLPGLFIPVAESRLAILGSSCSNSCLRSRRCIAVHAEVGRLTRRCNYGLCTKGVGRGLV